MKNILVVAPHPDDETLGCGGTLLKHIDAGDRVSWVIVTAMVPKSGYSASQRAKRRAEISAVAKRYGFSRVDALGLPTARLDVLPRADLVKNMAEVYRMVEPEVVYLPFYGDAHSDHRLVFEASTAAAKWFRQKNIRRLLCYETPSETGLGFGSEAFQPNVFVNIEHQIVRKQAIARLYTSEMGVFPFPRSPEVLEALAAYRGVMCGCRAAEAFLLLREVL